MGAGPYAGICILHVLVFDKSSLIYIDLLSQGPGLNLFNEVWATSMAALTPPSPLLPHHLTLKFTDYCHRNVAIFTCLRRLFNGSVFPCAAITQQQQIIKGLRKEAVRVVHIGKLLNANFTRPLRELILRIRRNTSLGDFKIIRVILKSPSFHF